MSTLFVAWRPPQPETTGWRPVGRLEYDGSVFRFCYTHGARKPGFQPFTQMEDFEQVYESEALFPLFANRLLPPSRPEYQAYLQWSDFDPNDPPEPLVVLGVTEGIRQTDAIEVFPCPNLDVDSCYLNKFFLHGIRWMHPAVVERVARLMPDEALKIMADFQNPTDPHAVAVRTEVDRMMIGYVPRYLARDVWKLVSDDGGAQNYFELTVARVNPTAPLQNRVLCKMRACGPKEFRPCSEDDFLPIPTDVPADCKH